MKSAFAAILALTAAVTVVANDFPDNMPECGKICAQNMLGQAGQLGCGASDIACLCKNTDFGYGIRDCSIQVCSNVDDANIAINWGNKLCEGVDVSAGISSATSSTDGDATSMTEVVSTIVSGSSTFVTTASVTVTDSSSSVGSGISSGYGSSETASESGDATTITTPIVSTQTDDSTTFETTIGSTTFVSSQSSDASSETSSGQAAQMTGAPVMGFLAAAGLAAAFL